MSALRKYPVFSAALIALGLLLLGEGGCLCERVQSARKAHAKLEQKRRELLAIFKTDPAPTAENAAQIETDLALATESLATIRAGLKSRGPAIETLRHAPPPERPHDAFFDIAAFVEKMRADAVRHGVALNLEECFGFAEYTHAGPEQELIPAVFRERLIAQYLLETLFEARPQQLLALQRERPFTKASRASGESASVRSNGDASRDYLEIDTRIYARVPGFVEAAAFRVTFVGQTVALRSWLNDLARFELPLVVRAVEIEPAATLADDNVGVQGAAGSVTPLVRRSMSRFTVTVEFIDLAEPTS